MKWLAIQIILFYKRRTEDKPHVCRYTPTCSTYGLYAFKRFGFGMGAILMSDRIKRCNSSVPQGTYDPIPMSINGLPVRKKK